MASWWKPWTWEPLLSRWGPRPSDGDNFIRNLPGAWVAAFARAGVPVTLDTALQLAAVFCAVRVIAEGVAQVPLKVLREEERDGRIYRKPDIKNPVYNLLHRRPNSWMTSFEWRETMTMHAVLCGNGFSVISRVNGRPDELIPVHPDAMEVRFEGGTPRYRATIQGRKVDLERKDVFHLRGPSMDSVAGLPVVSLARSVLGLAMGLERSQEDLQRTGGRPSGILSNKGTNLSDVAKGQLKESWQKQYGPGGEGGIAVLDGAWEFTAMMMSAVDAQHIENRRFQIDEVGRVFRVLPMMLMQADKTATFASSEQFFIAHVVHTLDPWVKRWEHALDRDLIDDPAAYANFVLQGLMRGAAKDRAEYYTRALGSGGAAGWLTQNEVRELEDRDPHPDGDELFRGSQNAAPSTAPEAEPEPEPVPTASDETDA